MSSTSYTEVIDGLKRLKLSTIRQHLDDYLRLAESRSMSHLEFLTGLVKEELQGRDASNYQRRLRAARFPMAH